ncbi:MAG: aromatic ring-hydroxylating dioxygenase subunit alpha [Pseudomonadota bacterium]
MKLETLKLQKGDAPFSADPQNSFSLPARFYHDPEIYELERDSIFYRSWWCVGHRSQIATPGQFVTAQIFDQNVFTTRDRSGEYRAFYNVCQHRAHALLAGRGKTKLIVCPYHAWAYDLDGSLKRAPNSENVVEFNACDFSLKPVRVEEYAGFIFVNIDPDAEPLRDQAEDLEAEIRHYCPQLDDLKFAQRDQFNLAANWKVPVDNFLECYHCQVAHKDLVNLMNMDSYWVKTHRIYSTHIADAALSTDNTAYKFKMGEIDFGYAAWYLWPNLTIWVYPGEPNISTLQMIPTGPDRCIEYQDWFTMGGKKTKQLKDAIKYQNETLQPEDISLCESVQQGMKSNGYNQGRLIVDHELSEISEHGVHHFQRLVVDALGAELN